MQSAESAQSAVYSWIAFPFYFVLGAIVDRMHGAAPMKDTILESIQPVIESLEHVWIDENRLRLIGGSLDETILELPTWSDPIIYPLDDGGTIPYLLLFNTINFAFWGKDKWRLEYDGEVLDGAFGLMAALTRAVEEGIPILEGAYLEEMTEEQLRHILRGEGELLLFGERVEILREVGSVLVGEFGGSFSELYAAAGGSAPGLARLLVDHFPSFRDEAALDGADVKFYKRAQLASMMIYERYEGRGDGALRDIDDLTVAAEPYEQTIRRYVPAGADGVPQLDLVLLGVGNDGHVASLFPSTPDALGEDRKLVVSHFVPVLGRSRMTFTPPLINAARNVLMLVTGEAKADAVSTMLGDDEQAKRSLPAARVAPHDGSLLIVLDAPAASKTRFRPGL